MERVCGRCEPSAGKLGVMTILTVCHSDDGRAATSTQAGAGRDSSGCRQRYPERQPECVRSVAIPRNQSSRSTATVWTDWPAVIYFNARPTVKGRHLRPRRLYCHGCPAALACFPAGLKQKQIQGPVGGLTWAGKEGDFKSRGTLSEELDRHALPPGPIVAGAVAPNVEPVGDLFAVHDAGQAQVLV